MVKVRLGLILFFMVFLIPCVFAVPILPTEYYGTIRAYDNARTPLPIGTVIDAITADGNSCGSFTVSDSGHYGLLSCMGKENYTNSSGPVQGQNIIFIIDGIYSSFIDSGDSVWYSGTFQRLDLYLYPACGNSYCEITESCSSCPADCGTCPPDEPPEPLDATGGTGTGGGYSSGASAGIGSGAYSFGVDACNEDWICSEWSPKECPVDMVMTRSCEDMNSCGTEDLKPAESRSCTYVGNCMDGLLNQDEVDIDCGGSCDPCDVGNVCQDDPDCLTGFCHPFEGICAIATCNDSFLNQGEEDIDCGGPCKSCYLLDEKVIQNEYPSLVLCGFFPLSYFIISSISLLMLLIFRVIYFSIKMKKKDTSQIERFDTFFIPTFIGLSFVVFGYGLYQCFSCRLYIWLISLFILLAVLSFIWFIWIKYKKNYAISKDTASDRIGMLQLKKLELEAIPLIKETLASPDTALILLQPLKDLAENMIMIFSNGTKKEIDSYEQAMVRLIGILEKEELKAAMLPDHRYLYDLLVRIKRSAQNLFHKEEEMIETAVQKNIANDITDPMDFNKRLSPEEYFHLADGVIIKSVHELFESIQLMDDRIFEHHVNYDKNDFAGWVFSVYGNKPFAAELAGTIKKRDIIAIMARWLNRSPQEVKIEKEKTSVSEFDILKDRLHEQMDKIDLLKSDYLGPDDVKFNSDLDSMGKEVKSILEAIENSPENIRNDTLQASKERKEDDTPLPGVKLKRFYTQVVGKIKTMDQDIDTKINEFESHIAMLADDIRKAQEKAKNTMDKVEALDKNIKEAVKPVIDSEKTRSSIDDQRKIIKKKSEIEIQEKVKKTGSEPDQAK